MNEGFEIQPPTLAILVYHHSPTMSKLLVVFGATGQQGGSIVRYVLQDPVLSQMYKIRIITRNVNTEAAKQFGEKVEVVQGDVEDVASLKSALAGAHTVFEMTNPSFAPDGFDTEYRHGKTIADAAVEAGVKYIIFSTLPSIKEVSGGRYTKVYHFEAKAEIEKYIRSLPVKSAFFSPGGFMQNFASFPFMAPQKVADGTYVMANPLSPKTEWALIDAIGDTGKYIGAILAEPDRYQGETFCAAVALFPIEEIAALISKYTGKTVVHKQLSVEDWRNSLQFAADSLTETFGCIEKFNYWGPESEKLVTWANENARGKITTFEEWLEANPLHLE